MIRRANLSPGQTCRACWFLAGLAASASLVVLAYRVGLSIVQVAAGL